MNQEFKEPKVIIGSSIPFSQYKELEIVALMETGGNMAEAVRQVVALGLERWKESQPQLSDRIGQVS